MSSHRYTMLTPGGSSSTTTPPAGGAQAGAGGELRDATDAMQKAANAMIAVTETFRRQLHDQDEGFRQEGPSSQTPSYHPYRPDDIVGFKQEVFENRARIAAAQNRGSDLQPSSTATTPPQPSNPVSPTLSSNPNTVENPDMASPRIPLSSTAAETPIPAAATLAKFFPQRGPPIPRVTTVFPPHLHPQSQSDHAEMLDVDLSPMNTTGSKTKWQGGSTPTLVPTASPTRQSHAHTTSSINVFVTREESTPSHPNGLHSHPPIGAGVHFSPLSKTPGQRPSETGATGALYYPNQSTASFATTPGGDGGQQHTVMGGGMMSSLTTLPRDSMDEFDAPLFPGAGAGGNGRHLHPNHPYYQSHRHGVVGVKRGALGRSLRRAKEGLVGRLSPTPPSPPGGSERDVDGMVGGGTGTVAGGGNGKGTDAAAGSEKGDREPEAPLPNPTRTSLPFILLISLSDILILAALSQTLPAMFAIITSSFPTTQTGESVWYTSSYALTSSIFILPGNRLGQHYGRKKLFVLGMLWFAVWSVIAGFSLAAERAGGRGNVLLVFCRAMQGMGPAMVLPNGVGIMGGVYPLGADNMDGVVDGKRKRISWLPDVKLMVWGAAAPLGFVVGALMSGMFVSRGSWPWAFWSFGAVCLATAGLAMLALPSRTVDHSLDTIDHVQQREEDPTYLLLDLPGTSLLVSSLLLIAVAWTEAPICGWQTPYTYFLLILGLLLLGAFIYVEARAPYPLIPLARMCAATGIILGAAFAGWMAWGVFIVYLFIFLLLHRDISPLEAATQIIPFAIVGVLASMAVLVLLKRGFRHQTMFLISMVMLLLGGILLATAPVDQGYWGNIFVATVVVPIGMEFSTPAAAAMLGEVMPEGEGEVGPALVMMVVNYGIVIGLGVAGTVQRGVAEMVVGVGQGEADGVVVEAVRGGMYTGIGISVVGLVIAALLWMSERKGRKMREGGKEMAQV